MRKFRRKWIWFSVLGVFLVMVVGGWLTASWLTDRMLFSMFNDPEKTGTKWPSSSSADGGKSGVEGFGAKTDGTQADDNGGSGGATANGAEQPSGATKSGTADGKGASVSSSGQEGDRSGGGDVTEEQARQAQEAITAREKAKVMSVMLSKLNPSEIKLKMQLAQGGISVEEKKQAKAIILQKLSEEEYNELIAIAAKLGLSSGRSYDETKKDFKQK